MGQNPLPIYVALNVKEKSQSSFEFKGNQSSDVILFFSPKPLVFIPLPLLSFLTLANWTVLSVISFYL